MKPAIVTSLLICVLGISAGQILFKQAALFGSTKHGLIEAWVLSPWIWIAGAVYFVATVLWIYVLRFAPLSVAYPFMALAFVLVPIASRLVFGDHLRPMQMFGALVIMGGVALTSL
ncbi:EamA family transporter [Pararobbsia alpina]|uniref:4-amino-4-deoxy-L-arabinose-phosphoundecaprenol flippase subunit ArnE n=1 Tax=Pararobbsia alpina TaxID=621374 RepID=A0A6S7BMG6_9BURK|nr:4-amino-4-deoxy-L-arabinose-phosphoundecaprenol flippase subunit ArnE [Pararobbsia alpina]